MALIDHHDDRLEEDAGEAQAFIDATYAFAGACFRLAATAEGAPSRRTERAELIDFLDALWAGAREEITRQPGPGAR